MLTLPEVSSVSVPAGHARQLLLPGEAPLALYVLIGQATGCEQRLRCRSGRLLECIRDSRPFVGANEARACNTTYQRTTQRHRR